MANWRGSTPLETDAPQGRVAVEPRLTIGLPVFNGAPYLAETLDSLLAQDFSDFEIVIADNASTDATPDIIEQYRRRDPRIRSVRNDVNLGAAANYNRLVSLARGELFKWASSNDVCAPTYLSRCVEALDRDPARVLAYPRTVLMSEDGARLAPYDDRLDLSDDRVLVRLHRFALHREQCNAVFGVVRTDVLRRTGLIRPYVGSDVTLLAELLLVGPLHEVPERLFQRRITPTSPGIGTLSRTEASQWFDPHRSPTNRNPQGRLFVEIEQVIRTSSLPVGKRQVAVSTFAAAWGVRRLRSRARGALRRVPLVQLGRPAAPVWTDATVDLRDEGSSTRVGAMSLRTFAGRTRLRDSA